MNTEMESNKRLQIAGALIAVIGTDMIYHAIWINLFWGAAGEIGTSNLYILFKSNLLRV